MECAPGSGQVGLRNLPLLAGFRGESHGDVSKLQHSVQANIEREEMSGDFASLIGDTSQREWSQANAGSRIVEMPPLDKAGADRATSHSLIEPGELIFGATYVRKQLLEWPIAQSVSHCDVSLIFLYGS